MSKAIISRDLLGKIIDDVFDGAIEDASVIEEIYAAIKRHEPDTSAAANNNVGTSDQRDYTTYPTEPLRAIPEVITLNIVTDSSAVQELLQKIREEISFAQNPAPQPQTRGNIEAEIASVVQSVNEWDDRTSPDDYPEHLLITSEELSDILRNFAATICADIKE